MEYLFVSCASLITRKNIGCFVVESHCKNEVPKDGTTSDILTPQITEKLKELNLDLHTTDLEVFELTPAQFKSENMELNRFYSREEMLNRGNETVMIPK